jgi:hypothetical protein
MDEAGKTRVAQNYMWEKKGGKMNVIYRKILNMSAGKSYRKTIQ